MHLNDDLTKVQKFMPELKQAKNTDVKAMYQNYDKFDLWAFYKFCRKNPIDGSTQTYMRAFLDLE